MLVDWNRTAAFETPAFHVVLLPFFLVSCRAQPTRNALALRVKFPSRWKEAWSTLSRRWQRHPQALLLSPANRAFPACPVATCQLARVLPWLLLPSLALAKPCPDGKPPRRSRVAAWFARETLVPLWPIGKRRHILRRVRGELRAHPVATAKLRGTPSRHPAFAAARNSFLPSLGAPGRSQDRRPAKYRWIVSTAGRWHGRDNTGDPDRWDGRPMPLAGLRPPRAVARSGFPRFPTQSCPELFQSVESPQPRSLARAGRSPATGAPAPNLDPYSARASGERWRKRNRASPCTPGRG